MKKKTYVKIVCGCGWLLNGKLNLTINNVYVCVYMHMSV